MFLPVLAASTDYVWLAGRKSGEERGIEAMMERREKGGREEDGDGRFAFKNHGDVDEKSEK